MKWWLLGTIVFFILILSGLGFSVWNHQRQIEIEKNLALEAERKYEDKFRMGMVRIYQNLKLDHFLAAYKNLDLMPKPHRNDVQKVEEYLEVLHRIGDGLLQSQLLKESENIFLQIREYEGQISDANESLGRIESKRRMENTKVLLEEGARLMKGQRFREANQEFEKANLELRSIESLHYDDVSHLWEVLNPQLIEARFYYHMDEVEKSIKTCEKLLGENRYRELNEQISRVSSLLSRAAFLKPHDPLVKRTRERLINLDAEIGFRLPNSLPLWNMFKAEDQGVADHFFLLENYDFSPQASEKGDVGFSLNFKADPREPYFIVRYRIFFKGGQTVFNGHFITPDPTKLSEDLQSVEYLQEIPDALRKVPITRMEIKVFSSLDEIVSRVERAFRVS